MVYAPQPDRQAFDSGEISTVKFASQNLSRNMQPRFLARSQICRFSFQQV
jgi:hypothetical protein